MMKHIILFLVSFTLLASCTLERSGNGDLDGFWHLVKADTLDIGDGQPHVNDLGQQLVFWAFQSRLMMTVDRGPGDKPSLFYRFSHAGDSLIVSEPRFDDRESGDSLCTDTTLLRHYGIQQPREAFYIKSLSSSRMELQSKKLLLKFRKQ